jgi:hypothetical protein
MQFLVSSSSQERRADRASHHLGLQFFTNGGG